MNFFYKQTHYSILMFILGTVILLYSGKTVAFIQHDLPVQHKEITFEQPLTIAINATSFPYHATDNQGSIIGLMPDLWRLWAKKQGVDIRFVVLPWLETIRQVTQGKVDIHGGLSIVDTRRKVLNLSKSLFDIHINFYVSHQLPNIEVIDDLSPYTITVVKGSVHIDTLKETHPNLIVKIFDNQHDLYQAALNGEIFVFTGLGKLADNFHGYDRLIKKFPPHKVIRNQSSEYGVGVAKERPDLMAFIEQGFDAISREEIANIERKWLGVTKQKNSLLIAFSAQYPPYMGVSPSGEPQGLLIDVWRLWAKELGINIEFFAQDLGASLALVAEQKVDVLMAYPDHIETKHHVAYAQPIYLANSKIYLTQQTKNELGQHFLTLEQLINSGQDYSIGIWHNSTFKDQLLELYPQIKLTPYKSSAAMISAAERGDISGIIGLVDLINSILVRNNLQTRFYRLKNPAITISLAPVIHPDNTKLLNLINTGFNALNIESLITLEERWLKGNPGEYYYKNQVAKVELTVAEELFVKTRKNIRLGVMKRLAPVEFIDEQGQFSGINNDITTLISDRTGLMFTPVVFNTWQQLYQALLDNKIDMLGSITPTDEREQLMLFTNDYWQMPWVIVHPQYLGRKSKLEDFYGKEVAIIKGYYLITQLRKAHPQIKFKLVDDRDQALLALQEERVQGFITTMASATQLLKQEHIVTLMMSLMEDVGLEKNHFAVHSSLPILQGIINKGLVSITPKEKQIIYDNWFTLAIQTGLDKELVQEIATKVGLVILFVIVVIVIWNRRLQLNIKHREELEKVMKHMATHDELTGLANRVLLKDRLSNALAIHQRQALKMAVLFIDLDGFKVINDTHGHDVGDELLQQVASRLKGCIRSSDTAVRFGGDEFVLLLAGLQRASEASTVADKVLTLIQKEFLLTKTNASIGCSIGIAMYPDDADNDVELMKIADTLMYKVKAKGKNHYLFNS